MRGFGNRPQSRGIHGSIKMNSPGGTRGSPTGFLRIRYQRQTGLLRTNFTGIILFHQNFTAQPEVTVARLGKEKEREAEGNQKHVRDAGSVGFVLGDDRNLSGPAGPLLTLQGFCGP